MSLPALWLLGAAAEEEEGDLEEEERLEEGPR